MSAHEDPQSDYGLILLDMSFRAIALDGGAALILGELNNVGAQRSLVIPPDVQRAISEGRSVGPADFKLRSRRGTRAYKCRAFLMKSEHPSLPSEFVVVHLRRELSPADSLSQLCAEYELTSREQDVLEGIAEGLSSKELADRLDITPGTVKSFIRFILIKLGVKTRGAILAKLLEYSANR